MKKNEVRENSNKSPAHNNPSTPVVVVLLLSGLPGAGKSSVAAALQEALQQRQSSANQNSGGSTRQTGIPPPRLQWVEYDGLEEESLLRQLAVEKEQPDGTPVGANDCSDEPVEERLQAWRDSRRLALERLREMLLNKDNQDDSEKALPSQASLSSEKDSPRQNKHHIRRIILMDDNYYLTSMRKQVFATCQQVVAESTTHENVAMVSIFMDTPVDICLTRNQSRPRPIPETVITRMAQHMEHPGKKDTNVAPSNYWENVVWRLNGVESVESNVQFLLHKLLRDTSYIEVDASSRADAAWLTQAIVPPPVDPQIELDRLATERQQTRESVRHQIDQALRQAVKVVATHIHPKYGREANAARKQVLAQEHDTVESANVNAVMERFYDAFTKAVILEEEERSKLDKLLLANCS